MNNLVQVVLGTSLHMIRNLPQLLQKDSQQSEPPDKPAEKRGTGKDQENETSKITVDNDSNIDKAAEDKKDACDDTQEMGDGSQKEKDEDKKENKTEEKEKDDKEEEVEEEEEIQWTPEEKFQLLEFTAKVFLLNFPLYFAQKSLNPISIEVRL